MVQESLLRQLFLQSEILPLHSQLLHLLDLQLVREELSVTIIVLCLKFILFFSCFNNGFVKSCLSRAASPISGLGSIWYPEYPSFLLYPFRQFRQAGTRAIGCTRYVKSCLSRAASPISGWGSIWYSGYLVLICILLDSLDGLVREQLVQFQKLKEINPLMIFFFLYFLYLFFFSFYSLLLYFLYFFISFITLFSLFLYFLYFSSLE